MQSLKVRGPFRFFDFQTLLVLGPLQKLLLPFIFHGSVPLHRGNLGIGYSMVVDVRVEKMGKSASKLQKMKSLSNYLYFTEPEAQNL